MELFPVYSLSKTFSAAAVLASGIGLDDRIGTFVALPAPFQKLTVSSVLSHRSGLPDYGNWPSYRDAISGGEPWSFDELMERTAAAPPGQAGGFRYSNIGYAIVRRMLENHAGSDYFDVLSSRVFPALGVTDALPFAQPADWQACMPSVRDARDYHPGWVLPGTFVSSAPSLERAFAALLGGVLVDPTALLGTVGLDAPGHPFSAPGYGLGLMTDGPRAWPAMAAAVPDSRSSPSGGRTAAPHMSSSSTMRWTTAPSSNAASGASPRRGDRRPPEHRRTVPRGVSLTEASPKASPPGIPRLRELYRNRGP